MSEITTQAVREMAERLERGRFVYLYRNDAASMLLALVEERDRLAALTNETMEALQKIGEEFGVHGGERRVDGIRRVLTELRARAEAAEAALREMRSEEMIERVARAWATMDGKADLFDREKGLPISEHIDDPAFTGAHEGYMEEARELMRRSGLINGAALQGGDGDG